MISITIVGKGNVATHYYKIMKEKGLVVKMISSRGSFCSNDFCSNIVILAIKDEVLKQVALQILQALGKKLNDRQILVHTSGFTETSFLQVLCNNYGSLYPLQSLKKDMQINFSSVPLCTWANTTWASQVLDSLAFKLSPIVYHLTDNQRKKLHIAAVFANNFTNHLFHISQTILEKENLDFKILLPLISRTVEAIKEKDPLLCQTGPATREDYNTINEHIALLSQPYKEIYKLLTQSIINTKKENKIQDDKKHCKTFC